MAAAIAFQTLGPVGLADAAGRELHALLAQPRRLALLAYLAVAAPRGLHRRDAILTLFWPELDQQHARAALRQALRVIRGSLGAVLTSRGDDEIVAGMLDADIVSSAFSATPTPSTERSQAGGGMRRSSCTGASCSRGSSSQAPRSSSVGSTLSARGSGRPR